MPLQAMNHRIKFPLTAMTTLMKVNYKFYFLQIIFKLDNNDNATGTIELGDKRLI
jgi:hypothetical protein